MSHPNPAGRQGRSAGEGRRPSLAAWLHSDYMAAAVIAAICAYLYYVSTWIIEIPAALAQGIQPASYPQGVIAVILLFTVLMVIEARNKPLEEPEPVPGLAYWTMAAMIGALAIATWVDFFLAMIVFVAVCVPLWGMRRYMVAILYAVVMTVILYLMFATLLRVRFPDGVLEDVFRALF